MAQLPGPAAATNVAAVKEETAAWEDALDLGDSDIRFDPRSHPFDATASQLQEDKPPHPSHHHHHHSIPGTAAAAVLDTVLPLSVTRPPLSLGRGDARATDADFLRPPWHCALQFLGNDRAWERPGIRAIKGDEDLLRALWCVAGVVTSCKPNGLGDLFLILKDATNSIGASVHKKVLLEENNGHDISIGCAVVFSKVAIFRPSRKLCYLNVTKGKVIKVFTKDCAAPAKQVISSSTTERSQGGDSTSNIMMKIFGREDMMPSNNEMTGTEVSHEHHATPDSSNSASTWDIYGGFSVGSNQEGKLLVGDTHNKHTSSSSTDEHPQQNLSIPNTTGCFSTPKENVNTSSGSLLKRKRAVSEWTEEQLSELFADY
ncbi:uncharacterized protein [Miscanthus floridulus]|uniref:uncharacterized protein n=1 Tax=Miscanthus floridulus TaxID=154761 RepID=UPI00345A9464